MSRGRELLIAVVLLAAACVPSPGPQGPQIDGDPVVGGTLTVDPGEWWFGPTSFSFAWSSCAPTVPSDCEVVGDGSQSYSPVEADVGRTIRVSVRAMNEAGTSIGQTASAGPVRAADPGTTTTSSTTSTSVPENTGVTAIGSPTTVVTTVAEENATRTFTGTAGQALTLSVSGNTFSGGVSLVVRQPSNGIVASLLVSNPTGLRDVFTLPVTGTYTVEIDPLAAQIGSLTFLLTEVPDNTGVTAIGSPTTVTTTVPGEVATRTFTGTAGQALTLSVSGNTFSGGVSVVVRQPSNGIVASLLVSNATGSTGSFTLPVTGTYTVQIDPISTQVGSVTFVLTPM